MVNGDRRWAGSLGVAQLDNYAYAWGVAGMINSRRRWFGLFFLLLASGMLIWGQTWLVPHLQGGAYVFYWTLCLILTLLALATAIVDARVTRRQLRQQQMELLKKTLGGEVEPPKGSAKKPNRR